MTCLSNVADISPGTMHNDAPCIPFGLLMFIRIKSPSCAVVDDARLISAWLFKYISTWNDVIVPVFSISDTHHNTQFS